MMAVMVLLALNHLPIMAVQSGAGASRPSGREYGVNLTFAVYQFDQARSPAMEEVTRQSNTFASLAEEVAHLKDKYKLEEVESRHVRSVGLRAGETFNDAVLLGPEYMTFTIAPRQVMRGYLKLDLRVRYANEPLLDARSVEFENYETVLLRGGRGMFGVKLFVGAAGRQESAPVERTLLISVTPEIVPVTSLRDRPEQLSHPVDEYGAPLRLSESDRFTPPVALERVVPKFEAGRSVTGAVLLAGVVTPDGRMTNIRVLRSIEPDIDERAIAAFRQYTFSPALLNGKPVAATYREELRFAPARPSLLEIQQELERERKKAEEEKERQRRRRP